jgi:hypothetical protein
LRNEEREAGTFREAPLMGDLPGALVVATHDRRLREALSLEREVSLG